MTVRDALRDGLILGTFPLLHIIRFVNICKILFWPTSLNNFFSGPRNAVKRGGPVGHKNKPSEGPNENITNLKGKK